MVQSQSLGQASALALAWGSNQTQSLSLYMVVWCEPGPWPFQRPLPLGSWALVFGFWAMSSDLGLLKVLGLGLGTWLIARRIRDWGGQHLVL